MHSFERLSPIWNWLPAFRAVAETEHLPAASALLHVSAGALSRTIRQLEDQLGEPLFDRVGRRLVLNPRGRQLLDAVRRAMRELDEGWAGSEAGAWTGPLHVSSTGAITDVFVMPAMLGLRRRHRHLVPCLHNHPHARARDALLRGDVEVAFGSAPETDSRLETLRLGDTVNRVYAGAGHPLFARHEPVGARAFARYAFAIPTERLDGASIDGWPPELSRAVGMQVHQLRAAVEVCLTGGLLAFLPSIIAEPHVAAGELRAVECEVESTHVLYAAHRPSPGATTRARAVIDAVRAAIAAAQRRPQRAASCSDAAPPRAEWTPPAHLAPLARRPAIKA